MIGRLTGTVVAQEADGSIVIDVSGVGYAVNAPLGALGRAQRDGDRVTLHVHTHVREDQITLFGFATLEDRAAFRMLLGVSNVGPKIALSVLSALPAGELAHVVAHEERARLSAISGIGKKTAERLVFDLKDKLTAGMTAPHTPAVSPLGHAGGPSKADRLTGALVNMGFRGAQVEQTLATLRPKLEENALEDLLRQALALLAR